MFKAMNKDMNVLDAFEVNWKCSIKSQIDVILLKLYEKCPNTVFFFWAVSVLKLNIVTHWLDTTQKKPPYLDISHAIFIADRFIYSFSNWPDTRFLTLFRSSTLGFWISGSEYLNILVNPHHIIVRDSYWLQIWCGVSSW